MIEQQPPSPRLLFKVDQAAEALSVSRTTIYQAISQGLLKTTKIGRATRITLDELKRVSREGLTVEAR
jgi:excisionase family DNA binding protein